MPSGKFKTPHLESIFSDTTRQICKVLQEKLQALTKNRSALEKKEQKQLEKHKALSNKHSSCEEDYELNPNTPQKQKLKTVQKALNLSTKTLLQCEQAKDKMTLETQEIEAELHKYEDLLELLQDFSYHYQYLQKTDSDTFDRSHSDSLEHSLLNE
jgi:hypothetical protein